MLHSNGPAICVNLDSHRNLLVFCTGFNWLKWLPIETKRAKWMTISITRHQCTDFTISQLCRFCCVLVLSETTTNREER